MDGVKDLLAKDVMSVSSVGEDGSSKVMTLKEGHV